ncbi:MAG: hypothetical protein ACREMB_07640 [Candidatus Rokuibacteriota bacterium]
MTERTACSSSQVCRTSGRRLVPASGWTCTWRRRSLPGSAWDRWASGRSTSAGAPAHARFAAVPVRSDPADAEVLAAFAEGREEPLPAYRLNRWGHTLALTPGFDELVSLPFLRDVIPYEHQIAAVETVLNQMRGRALLADEVGLGKTVEAAIILAELWRRRLSL